MWDPVLIDLFRSEVETHSEALSSALLELERAPGDTSRIDEMMRAAHSIKGAARVVGVDPAVRVAHVMEDCFVAAQKRILPLSSADVDVLLRGVDLLANIAAATSQSDANIGETFDANVRTLVAELENLLSRKTSDATLPETPFVSTGASRRELEANQVTIIFPALLDAVEAESIRQQVVSAVESRCELIRFDLARTVDLDIQGLAFLAAVPGYLAEHRHSRLELGAISSAMQTVLRVSGLDVHYAGEHRSAREEC